MHVGEISFCDRVAYNIKSEETKKCILDHLNNKYGLKIVHKHFEKFTQDKSIPILQNNPHLVCVRSNGNPYFLYLMKYNFIQYCIFIDKKIQQGYYLPRMIIVQMMFDDCMFDDTVFDGEMIKAKNGSWYYLINDLLVCKGSKLQDLNLPRRINLLYDTLTANFKPEEYDPFKIGVKEFFRYDQLHDMFSKHIQQLTYTSRGIYFKPLYMKFKDILLNFDDTLVKKVERIKYTDTSKPFVLMNDITLSEAVKSTTDDVSSIKKPVDVKDKMNSKTFSVRKTATPDVYELYEGTCMQGIACVPTMVISKKMRELTKSLNMIDKIELPFEYSTKFNKWVLSLEGV